MQPYDLEDMHADSLVLALHGKQGVKFLDAVERIFLDELTLSTHGLNIEACALWSTRRINDTSGPDHREVQGIFIENGLIPSILDVQSKCLNRVSTLSVDIKEETSLKNKKRLERPQPVMNDTNDNTPMIKNKIGAVSKNNTLESIVLGTAGLSELLPPWTYLGTASRIYATLTRI